MSAERDMKYMDVIDLLAQTALGRLNAAAKKVRSRAGEGLHDEMVKLLTEAHAAGKREALETVDAVRVGVVPNFTEEQIAAHEGILAMARRILLGKDEAGAPA